MIRLAELVRAVLSHKAVPAAGPVTGRPGSRARGHRGPGFTRGRPKAARLTPVDSDGRASVIRVNRERRRAAQSAARMTAAAA